jgi:hypothetical protein
MGAHDGRILRNRENSHRNDGSLPGAALRRHGHQPGTVRLNDNHLRLTWGSMLHHVAITGTIRPTGQFEGRYSLQNLGIASEAPDKVTGERLTLSASTPDTASKSGFLARVLSEMAQGALTVPLDPRATTVKF